MEKKQCDSGDLGDKDLSRWFHHSGLVREKREIGGDMSKVCSENRLRVNAL